MKGYQILLKQFFSKNTIWGKIVLITSASISLLTIQIQFVCYFNYFFIVKSIIQGDKVDQKKWHKWLLKEAKKTRSIAPKKFEHFYHSIVSAHNLKSEVGNPRTLYMNHIEVKTGPLPYQHGAQYEYQYQPCAGLENDNYFGPFAENSIKKSFTCWRCGGEMRRDKKLMCRNCYVFKDIKQEALHFDKFNMLNVLQHIKSINLVSWAIQPITI